MLSEHKYIILVILLMMLIRIPALLLWSPTITGSDSAMYMETARNLAEGKGFVCSVCRFHMDKERLDEYIQTHGNRYQGMSRAPIYVILMSLVYLISGKAHFMTGVILLNMLLLAASLIIVYRFMQKKYPGHLSAYIIAIIWIGGSFTLFNYSFGAWLESFTLFNFVLAFVLHSHLLRAKDNPWWLYLIYGFVLASLFTIKRSTMPIAGAFILHMLLQKKLRSFLYSVLFFGGFTVLWYGLRYFVMPIPPLYPFSHNFPYSGFSREVSAIPNLSFSLKSIATTLKGILSTAMNMKQLGLLFPFALIYLVGAKNDKEKQSICLIIGLNLAVYCFFRANPSPRYIFPIFVPLIIYAAILFDSTVDKLFAHKKLIIVYVFIMFTFFYQLTYITGFTIRAPQSAKARESVFHMADELLDKYNVPDDAIVVFNVRGYNVYSDRGYILTPPNTDNENYRELIDAYDVDYILHCNGLTQYYAWFERTIGIEMFEGLPLVETVYLEDLMSLRLYRAKPEFQQTETSLVSSVNAEN